MFVDSVSWPLSRETGCRGTPVSDLHPSLSMRNFYGESVLRRLDIMHGSQESLKARGETKEMNAKEVYALTQALEDTRRSVANEHSVTYKLAGDHVLMTYSSIMNFSTTGSFHQQAVRETDRSTIVLNNALSAVKARFKESTGRALKVSIVSSKDSLESISASAISPRQTSYYRRVLDVEVA